jgi:PUD1/2-like protein
MNTRDLPAKILKLLCVVCVGCVVAAPSQAFAVTKRTAQVNVVNNSGRDIEIITVSHKYSDNYKNSETWLNLPNGAKTKAPLVVEYNTGFGTTGRDWWRISWKFKGDPGLYVTNPNNFRREIDALESIGPGVLVAAGTALGSLAGGAAGGAAGTYLAPGVGTTYGAAAGKAVGGKAGAAAAKAMADALMNGESTVGFKQHILRSEDESGKTPTIIEIKADGVTFRSPSGNSDTVYVKSGNVPIDSSLDKETRWSVAGFEHGQLGTYHPVPWVFHANKQVNAGNLWAGVWTEVGENKIVVSITHPSGETDTCEVIFVSSRWFVAVKNGDLYRLGKRE